MQINDESDNLFIISKDFHPKQEEEIKLIKYYDCVKNSFYTLIIQDAKLFICFKVNHFGSVFNGNYVCSQANTLIVQQMDPSLLFVNILYATSRLDEDKFSCLSLNDIVYKYGELLERKKLEEEILNSSRELLNFMKDYFDSQPGELEKISEKTYNSFMDGNYYKLSVSKILTYLDKKCMQRNEKTNHTNDAEQDCKNSASILTNFLPDVISESFLKFKNVVFEDTIKNNLIDEETATQKRKNNTTEEITKTDKKQKPKNVSNKPTQPEDKSQKNILNFFKRK